MEYQAFSAATDFDGNGIVGCHDVDALVRAIAAPNPSSILDQIDDGMVDEFDLDLWLVSAGRESPRQEAYLHGDFNLDGIVDAIDLNKIGEHWQQSDAGWCDGDANADGKVDAIDLNLLAENWLQGGRTAVDAVRGVENGSLLKKPLGRRFDFGMRRQR